MITVTSPVVELAVKGGPRAVTVEPRERWEPPREQIKKLVCQMIDEDIYTLCGTGSVQEFERRIAEYFKVPYAIAFNHGTAALWAGYFAAGVGPGDEVLHPCFTWISSIAPAVHLGARPVFCEIDPERLVIDPADAERRITAKTKAISVVHLHGNVCNMDAILDLARRHGLAVIEDCSHCHGAEWDGKKLGTLGQVGCFSMQGSPPSPRNGEGGKPLAGGEAGFALTNDRKIYERMLLFGQLNRKGLEETFTEPAYRALAPTNLGLKFRPHPWALAPASVLMESLDERNQRRATYRRRLEEAFCKLPGVRPLKSYPKAKPAGFHGGIHFIYHPEELGGLPAHRFISALEAEGVRMKHREYPLIHALSLFGKGFDLFGNGKGPLCGNYPGYPKGSFPVSEEVHGRILGMPSFVYEEPGYSDQIIQAFRKVTGQYQTLLA